MSNVVIKVENLSKKYIIGHQTEKYYALRDVIMERFNCLCGKIAFSFHSLFTTHDSRSEEFWALKDVSFDIKQGDRVGRMEGDGRQALTNIDSN